MTAQPGGRGELADDDLNDLNEGELDDAAAEDQVSADAGEAAPASGADVIVAEVVDVTPSLEPDGSTPPPAQQAGSPEGDTPAETMTPAEGARLSQQWHAILAMFVDDPGGAVQLAGEAAEAAVRAVVSTLERQQARMPKPDDAQDYTADTEQLRTTLREFRDFCQRMDQLAGQRPGSGPER